MTAITAEEAREIVDCALVARSMVERATDHVMRLAAPAIPCEAQTSADCGTLTHDAMVPYCKVCGWTLPAPDGVGS